MKHKDYITCRELIDFISDYLDGTLTSAERGEFDRHLNDCPSCRAYLQSYQRTIALSHSAFADPDSTPPPSVPEEFLRAIISARRQTR